MPVPALGAPAAAGMVKSSPKAIKEPYSDRAVRELTLNASSVPAPLNAAIPAASTAATAAPSAAAPSTAAPATPVTGAPAPSAPSGSDTKLAAATPAGDDALNWMWPAKGKVVTEFSDAANLKGIDIAGAAGQPVYASAAGRVVYAGSGLRGYGKLIIIKHNATYLSAYAHNSAILVKEGQQVARGQEIAEMGDTDANRVSLHFEIRRFGKPMDPEKYLPPA
jgi:lipoprotein NlpD